MKILVTGATGFIGRHLVAALLKRGHEITATGLSAEELAGLPWRDEVDFIPFDMNCQEADPASAFDAPGLLVHLAWPGLPNYGGMFHIEKNLPASYRFIKKMVEAGTPRVLVTGTCFEYGMQHGPLSEDLPVFPANPYAIAKDSLHKFLKALAKTRPFVLQWVRLFYLYGPGQSPSSILFQLDKAIRDGLPSFNMSKGEQLRDYLPVEEAARRMAVLAEHPECAGVFNCASGRPISIRKLAETFAEERGSNIKLNLGYYPYSEYEPMAFWGEPSRLLTAIQNLSAHNAVNDIEANLKAIKEQC